MLKFVFIINLLLKIIGILFVLSVSTSIYRTYSNKCNTKAFNIDTFFVKTNLFCEK